MGEGELLAERFEGERGRLRAVAYRMLGSVSEAEDAVQEAWLRISRADTAEVRNFGGWATTVVARVCLNLLRSREARREEGLEAVEALESGLAEGVRSAMEAPAPEDEAVLAESVGLAMLVVLDTLSPAERVAFVLHDMFAVPFDEIGQLLERSPATARQLASRARRRVRGGSVVPSADLARRRGVVEAFLAAAREGDFDALLAVLDPEVVLRADAAVGPTRHPLVVAGARNVARGASAATARARGTQPALVDGAPALLMADGGRLALVMAFTITDELITGIDLIAEPERLSALRVDVLDAAVRRDAGEDLNGSEGPEGPDDVDGPGA
ncbi:sigma-70 family RNA polymerase sigma factor [Streptomyces sp. DSM 42041]|uniref:Sigma-70 family RNA polymerase sigma factor n=1 Tax=Streptomyces hazeniae TaxID=3075538 RepID=A0ABU2NP21_9ACTN|nr:sigma-70 family RNA polymerase sigma factor [Streptomyces sp. DSM 42041]MDT0377762.1 sigma-70 family RNA polymerase sigma factor [Streptomyces sp. DSM 42041]